ncbi:hypothetical protein [Aliivibrio salmonicida]|uniref:hypothetical protein n=1 Tax=Aliivibrio salmonicida TaxID=40269 RepID=UPI003D0EABE3
MTISQIKDAVAIITLMRPERKRIIHTMDIATKKRIDDKKYRLLLKRIDEGETLLPIANPNWFGNRAGT